MLRPVPGDEPNTRKPPDMAARPALAPLSPLCGNVWRQGPEQQRSTLTAQSLAIKDLTSKKGAEQEAAEMAVASEELQPDEEASSGEAASHELLDAHAEPQPYTSAVPPELDASERRLQRGTEESDQNNGLDAQQQEALDDPLVESVVQPVVQPRSERRDQHLQLSTSPGHPERCAARCFELQKQLFAMHTSVAVHGRALVPVPHSRDPALAAHGAVSGEAAAEYLAELSQEELDRQRASCTSLRQSLLELEVAGAERDDAKAQLAEVKAQLAELLQGLSKESLRENAHAMRRAKAEALLVRQAVEADAALSMEQSVRALRNRHRSERRRWQLELTAQQQAWEAQRATAFEELELELQAARLEQQAARELKRQLTEQRLAEAEAEATQRQQRVAEEQQCTQRIAEEQQRTQRVAEDQQRTQRVAEEQQQAAAGALQAAMEVASASAEHGAALQRELNEARAAGVQAHALLESVETALRGEMATSLRASRDVASANGRADVAEAEAADAKAKVQAAEAAEAKAAALTLARAVAARAVAAAGWVGAAAEHEVQTRVLKSKLLVNSEVLTIELRDAERRALQLVPAAPVVAAQFDASSVEALERAAAAEQRMATAEQRAAAAERALASAEEHHAAAVAAAVKRAQERASMAEDAFLHAKAQAVNAEVEAANAGAQASRVEEELEEARSQLEEARGQLVEKHGELERARLLLESEAARTEAVQAEMAAEMAAAAQRSADDAEAQRREGEAERQLVLQSLSELAGEVKEQERKHQAARQQMGLQLETALAELARARVEGAAMAVAVESLETDVAELAGGVSRGVWREAQQTIARLGQQAVERQGHAAEAQRRADEAEWRADAAERRAAESAAESKRLVGRAQALAKRAGSTGRQQEALEHEREVLEAKLETSQRKAHDGAQALVAARARMAKLEMSARDALGARRVVEEALARVEAERVVERERMRDQLRLQEARIEVSQREDAQRGARYEQAIRAMRERHAAALRQAMRAARQLAIQERPRPGLHPMREPIGEHVVRKAHTTHTEMLRRVSNQQEETLTQEAAISLQAEAAANCEAALSRAFATLQRYPPAGK